VKLSAQGGREIRGKKVPQTGGQMNSRMGAQNGTKGLESEISTFGYEKYQKGALSENPFAY
jgi:hypothetical protein